MSVRHPNATSQKILRGNSIPNNKNKVKPNPVQTKKVQNKDSKLIDKKRNIKVDYNSNNCFYNDEDYLDDYPDNKMEYYQKAKKKRKYNNETSDSYITVEQEDGQIKYIPKNYIDYKESSPILYNEKKVKYFRQNSDDSENNYNENINMYYENDDEFEQDLINGQSPIKEYNKYNKYYLTHNNSNNNNNKINKIVKNNQNVISRPINHQINFSKDMKRKGRTQGGNLNNFVNNTTTTNNTYNNNIYYINPINVKNKNKKEEINNKAKRTNTNKKNSVYKNVDITINKKPIKEMDYFKMNNIPRSQRGKYTDAAILIQSIFRGFLIKIKLYNNINLYVCYKKGVDILENIFLKRKKIFWKLYKNMISRMIEIINSKVSLNILKDYLKINKNNSREKKFVSFHKELGDSFNIINDNRQKEINEKKLKSKLNDVIKENTELKNQLVDNKNIEEKMKNLIDENKKNQNINAIIMKDNQQLAKRLKDIQDYRNTNLIIENQSTVDLTQIEELRKNNDIYYNQLKKIYLGKIVNKKINNNKIILKNIFNKYKNIIDKIKYKNNENKIIKELYLKNALNKISDKFKLFKQKYFLDLYYYTTILNEQKESKNDLKKLSLKQLINKKEKDKKDSIYKTFFKYYCNTIKSNIENKQKEEEEEDNEVTKEILLKKIFKNYQKNTKLIYKIFLEKWNLKSKIIGIRAAARDKKKKRKLKKKNNKLIYQKHFGIADKKDNPKTVGPKFSKSIHQFSYIVSNGTVIKESSSNEIADMNTRNMKVSTSSDKINKSNKLDKVNTGMVKTNNVNKIITQNKINNDNNKENNKENEKECNEDSDEDSGDSFGLDDNNSD